MRRLVASATIGCGVALIIFTCATSTFLRMSEAQVIRDRFRQITTAKGFGQFHDDVGEIAAGTNELVTKTYPKFASDFGMTGPHSPRTTSTRW